MTSAFIQMKDGFYDLDSTLPACLRWKRETNGFWHVVDRAEYTAGLNSRIPSQSSNDKHPQTSESLMIHTRTHVMQINSKKLAKTTCCCCCCSIHQWWKLYRQRFAAMHFSTMYITLQHIFGSRKSCSTAENAEKHKNDTRLSCYAKWWVITAAGKSDLSHPHQSCVSDNAKSSYLIKLVAD